MLHNSPTTLSKLLPGYSGSRVNPAVLLDGAFTRALNETRPLLIGPNCLLALGATVALTYRNAVHPAAAAARWSTLDIAKAGELSARSAHHDVDVHA